MHKGDLERRTPKGLRLLPGDKERAFTMIGLHDEIGRWGFATTYRIT